MSQLAELFFTFAKIGLFTFGGGYAMLSLIDRTCVEEKAWITHDEMMDITVIAESTPGPIAINCATYVGLKKKGLAGAIAATVGVVLPSFLIILLISFFLDRFLEIRWVANAFAGIKLAVGILIVDAAVRMIRKSGKMPLTTVILTISFAAMMAIDVLALRISTIALLMIAAAVGLAACFAARRGGEGAAK